MVGQLFSFNFSTRSDERIIFSTISIAIRSTLIFQLERGIGNGLLLFVLSCIGGCFNLCDRLLGFCDGIRQEPSSENGCQNAEVCLSREEEMVTEVEPSDKLENDLV